MNVLLTCGGRRNYLVRYFREALANTGRILVTDSTMTAPAMQEADLGILVPPVKDAAYMRILGDVCEREKIRLVLSLNDLELPILARGAEQLRARGVVPVISEPRVIDLCFDKWATCSFLESIGLKSPKTCLSLEQAVHAARTGEIRYPVVVKPRWGTASIGIEFPEDEDELMLSYALVKKRIMRTFLADVSSRDIERCVMIQERLEGQEYGLDVVNDLAGNYVATFVKKKLAMRAGETDRAETVLAPEIESVGAAIGRALGHVGNLDCDVFMTPVGPVVLEMNPRFGGGYPFSHEAGADVPAALLAWAEGREPDPNWLRIKPGICSSKCDRLVRVAHVAG